MKKLVPATAVTEVTDFPYSVGKPWMYGCNPSDPTCRELLDSLLYAVENPDTPDDMTYVYDIVGLTEWYDQVVPSDEKEEYDCPTVYDYIACEIGRCLYPLKWVEGADTNLIDEIKRFAIFQMEGSAYDGFTLVSVQSKDDEPVVNPWMDFNGNTLTDDEAVSVYGRKAFNEFIRMATAILNTSNTLKGE